MSAGGCSSCGLEWRTKSPGCARHAHFDEIAAVYEFDGKLTREKAERLAVMDMARAVYGGGK